MRRCWLLLICVLWLMAGAPAAAQAPSDEPRAVTRDDLPGRGAPDYLVGALRLTPPRWDPAVRDSVPGAWLLGALFSAAGGHLWAPRLAFRHVPPNAPRRAATWLGVLGTLTPWVTVTLLGGAAIVTSVAFALSTHPTLLGTRQPPASASAAASLLLPPLGAALLSFLVQAAYVVFPLVAGVELLVNWYVVPRAIADAYSDAYALKRTEGY